MPDIVEESGEPSEIDECSEPPKKKVARKKVVVYFMLSLSFMLRLSKFIPGLLRQLELEQLSFIMRGK